jgi:GTP-binding protein HflX
VSDAEHASSLAELERLGATLGLEIAGRVTQRRQHLAAGKVLGDGKLVELASWTGGTGVVPRHEKAGSSKRAMSEAEAEEAVDGEARPGQEAGADGAGVRASLILVDHELTPTQQRNLERATGAEVHDRTSVILGIFQRHARTREARLQVEIAQLAYLAPRLRESGGGDRVRGGIGGKGAGESALELDRRRIRDRIAELRRELVAIEGTARVQRGRRSDLPTVALVGYTNAGKSSLMRALTGSAVYVADELFATLGTTVRVLAPRTDPPILVTDTVGFIKKLPHDLVASFRSTLDEAAQADLLLKVVDASDPDFRQQIQVTRDVLFELDGTEPHLLLLNKIDLVSEATRSQLAADISDAIQLSAHQPADVSRLRDLIQARFLGELEDAELVIPWSHQRMVHQIHERCRILSESHEPDGTRMAVRAPRTVLARLRDQLSSQAPAT